MLPQPIISTNYYYPVYTETHKQSRIDKCLDRVELKDIRYKQLRNEELDDLDIERLDECVSAPTIGDIGLLAAIIVVAVLVLVFMVGYTIWVAMS